MNNINWQQFELCNADKNTAFENLCRLLFNRMFFDNKAIFHSNPASKEGLFKRQSFS